MTTQPIAAVPDPDDSIPLVESDPDDATFPFRLAYRRGGKRVVETFAARHAPPFAIFRLFRELETASATNSPQRINDAVRQLLVVALPDEDAIRLLALIEGDEGVVGVVTPQAIGGIVDVLREHHYKIPPTQRGSQPGAKRTAKSSQAGRSAKAGGSTRSTRAKA